MTSVFPVFEFFDDLCIFGKSFKHVRIIAGADDYRRAVYGKYI